MYDSTKPYRKKILDLIKQTWETPYISIKEDIYSTFKKKFSYPEVDHTDGIGTKGIYHWRQRTFKNAVLDALAMNLNDLALARATPYKLQNHILIPEDDQDAILEIVESLVEECKWRNIAVTGGETSIHHNIEGLEISLTVSGFIKTDKSNKFKIGDVMIGVGSNGLHANGFTKIKEVFSEEDKPEFVRATSIYLETILKLNEEFDIHGMTHITGGAFTKIKDLLSHTDAVIYDNHPLAPQEIFFELYQRGIFDEEMYKTFNCGIGFILGVDKNDVDEILKQIKEFKNGVIGEIIPGKGKIKIQSQFSKKEIEY